MRTIDFTTIANNILEQCNDELNLYQAMELAAKLVQAQALADLANAFRQDGEFQESMTQIANALK